MFPILSQEENVVECNHQKLWSSTAPVECHQCKEWYHTECVTVPKEALEMLNGNVLGAHRTSSDYIILLIFSGNL